MDYLIRENRCLRVANHAVGLIVVACLALSPGWARAQNGKLNIPTGPTEYGEEVLPANKAPSDAPPRPLEGTPVYKLSDLKVGNFGPGPGTKLRVRYERLNGEERGTVFETLCFHELNAHIAYLGIGGELFYWRTADGAEIDFIWKRGKKIVAIEAKSTNRWRDEFNNGFKSLLSSHLDIHACYGVYLGNEILQKEFGAVLPWREFLKRLYEGLIIS